MPGPTPLITALRVRFVECDMQGHVFNGHYLMYFDLAHTEALRSASGLTYPELVQAHGVDFVVAESGVRYLAPAYYDDLLEIAVTFEPLTASSLTSRFAVVRDGDPIATGFLRHVCVDSKNYKKTAWPDAFRGVLEPYIGEPASS
ncbi:Putative esterase [Baekduia alba]|uniref:acyl-CoA thioesterase n=1 Tax=Baekduia alba TaxID=2997333 RepID=UPI002340BDE3|nr:thioesterase family protein [Baekduia alba]WCB92130.1 Putative esterase [Baekduia alba]